MATTMGGDILGVYLGGTDPGLMDVSLEGETSLVYRAQLTEETIRGG